MAADDSGSSVAHLASASCPVGSTELAPSRSHVRTLSRSSDAHSDPGAVAEERKVRMSKTAPSSWNFPGKPLLVTWDHLRQLEDSCEASIATAKTEAVEECDRRCFELGERVEELRATLTTAMHEAIDGAVGSLERRVLGEIKNAARMAEDSRRAGTEELEAKLSSLGQSLRDLDGRAAQHAEQAARRHADLSGSLDDTRAGVAANRQRCDEAGSALELLHKTAQELRQSIEELHGDADARLRAREAEAESVREELHELQERSDECCRRLDVIVEAQASFGKLQDKVGDALALAEETKRQSEALESVATRRVNFVMEGASRLLQEAEASAEAGSRPRSSEPGSYDSAGGLSPRPPSERGSRASLFSPTFGVAGLEGFELELRPAAGGQRGGELTMLLWGLEGTHAHLRLYFGTASVEMQHCFGASLPCVFGSRCLQDAADASTDSLSIGVEVLEGYRTATRKPVPMLRGARGAPGAREESALHGRFQSHLHLLPVALERLSALEQRWDHLQSRVVGRVEWRIEQATLLQRCFARGSCLCSVPFAAGGFSNLQLVFYPSGDSESRDNCCSFYLYAPGLEALRCWLVVGKQRRDALAALGRPAFFGRSNFCLYEGTVDKGSDSLLLALEVAEAQQMAPTDAAVPWPALASCRRNPAAQQLPPGESAESAYAEAIASRSRLQGAPGRVCVEDVRLLPAVWAPAVADAAAARGSPGLMSKAPLGPGQPQGFRPLAECAEASRVATPPASHAPPGGGGRTSPGGGFRRKAPPGCASPAAVAAQRIGAPPDCRSPTPVTPRLRVK